MKVQEEQRVRNDLREFEASAVPEKQSLSTSRGKKKVPNKKQLNTPTEITEQI